MTRGSRINYYRRIFSAYLTPKKSQLTFWHEVPEINHGFETEELGEYYMTFAAKADYEGQYDNAGIPMLNYHGETGLQYNPIAIAQYGLGNYNLMRRTESDERRQKFINVANWLVSNLEQNSFGHWVWNHKFDWEYRTLLKSPWYSGLAQGQGISVLVRAHRETGDAIYLEAAHKAFQPFLETIDKGGVAYVDEKNEMWIEEYIVYPPTHILNGFIWAIWGVYDYFIATGDPRAEDMYNRSIETIAANLQYYDIGFWSLYEWSGTRLKMIASPFYHSLHIVQLQVLHKLTGKDVFLRYALKWESYRNSRVKKLMAIAYKVAFKLIYY